MKKLFLVLLLFVFVGITQAQNTNKPTSTMTEQQIANKIFERTLELIRVKVATAIALDSATIASITSSTTSNGSLEATQLLVKKVLQAVRPSGKSYYSSLEGDFTATPIAGAAGKVAITGLPFILDHKDVVYAAKKPTAGEPWVYLGFEPTMGTNDTLVFAGNSFVSTDQVDIVIVGTPKTIIGNANIVTGAFTIGVAAGLIAEGNIWLKNSEMSVGAIGEYSL